MEIGSEFNLSMDDLFVKENNIYSYLSEFENSVFYDSGRSALHQLASCLKPTDEILLPEFICSSVIEPFSCCKIEFYKINKDFTLNVDDIKKKIRKDTKVFFLMHYFGMVQPYNALDEVKSILCDQCVVVEDTTHSIFSKVHTIGDYHICSLRKWMPIPRGGVMYYSEDKLNLGDVKTIKSHDNSKAYGMVLKDLFLGGNYNTDLNSMYRDIFLKSERLIDMQTEPMLISDFSAFAASCVDISKMVDLRRQNYRELSDKLIKFNIDSAIDLKEKECPLVLPIRVKNRDLFRDYLINNRIYCAVHWPFDGIMIEKRQNALQLSNELLSIPIDQRYGIEHINYLIDVVSRYKGELVC